MKAGKEKGVALTTEDVELIRAELQNEALRTGYRAYTYRYDGDDLTEFRAWPNGPMLRSPVERSGLSLAAPTVVPLPNASETQPRRAGLYVASAAVGTFLVGVGTALGALLF